MKMNAIIKVTMKEHVTPKRERENNAATYLLTGFCFGHLIHSCLMLGRQILHFTSDDPKIKVY